MSEHDIPTPVAQPERPAESRTRRAPPRSPAGTMPEVANRPRFLFTDFAMI